SQSSGADSGTRPSLSQVKKSWGFRRTTIAQREFMEEVGDATYSPPLVRRGRSRKANKTPETNTEGSTKQRTQTARSVIENLQWSAPSSPVSEDSKEPPVSEDSKEPPETSAGGAFDPSLWQDFGSAFHTAFSLLGGDEGLPFTDALAVPDFLGPANEIEGLHSCFVCLFHIVERLLFFRFMICCNSCQEWFHSACVGISETQEWTIEEKEQEYTCLTCTTTRQTIIHLESHLEPDLSFPECLTLSPPETRPEAEAEGDPEAEVEAEAEPQSEMETDGSLGLCTGPGCAKQALPDSVYCGTDCILQHAAITMKTLSSAEVSKSKRPQRKAAAVKPAKVTDETSHKPEIDTETITPKQAPEEPPKDAPLLSQPVTEEPPLQNLSQEKEPENTDVSDQQTAAEGASTPATPEKSDQPPATQAPSTSAVRYHEMGALIVKKTTYVIPKKQPVSQAPCSQPSQKTSSVPTLLNETRNLLVPPAPSAPSSRPSQPNNQVRQSIQRSLTTILFKRVSDCEDLEMPEREVVKLVAGIEKEMFDIFRNTDSKYMNKYRTIMFNLKDPKNKGLLYRVVNGEIGPFRLVRMTQKDMQATKAPEPTTKETTQEHKKVSHVQPTKPKVIQPSKNNKAPDILSCMLKDTTSEHKAHLFDLKCKICTAAEDQEPAKKKMKVSTSRDKTESTWKKPGGDGSPLLAPPDTPGMDSPTSSLMEPSSQIDIDSPKLTIVESPASPVMDSPASPTLESPASPIMESPASPTPESCTVPAPRRSYTPVVVPTVSTVTITRRDPRTAANRFTASPGGNSSLGNSITKQASPYVAIKGSPTSSSTPPPSLPPPKAAPKSILMKPSSSADPRLYSASSRYLKATVSQTSTDGDTPQFLAKQGILWKGFLNMLTVAKFVTKGYLVSGPAESLKADLPDTIQIGGRIPPETVWDYVEKLKTSITKELCVIRFHPATEEEEVAYVSLFSYFSSRGRFGVVANISRSIKDVYLVPLGANESIPSILQPFDGPGLEKNRPNLLLGLAIVQKLKRPGSLPQEVEEKKLKVNMSKDPMWIPKPPVLYGSDKFDVFKPYDPETAGSSSAPGSPSWIGSPSDSSSSGSVTMPVTSSATAESTSVNNKNVTPSSSNKTPLQTILKTLFGGKESDPTATSDGISPKTAEGAKKKQVLSKAPGSMVDPIVQQYGQKSKVKKVKVEEEEEQRNDFDRPYDPEEEYDAAKGYKIFTPQITDNNKTDDSALFVEDDVAYDPEDETIFEVFQSDGAVTKLPIPTQSADAPSFPTTVSNSIPTTLTSNTAPAMSTLPTGAIVVSAATLSEQQRMLEELNKQIEEQKRQLKQQEEVLRQQREAVGMFMAHFSVSDTLMSPPTKSLPNSQLQTVQCDVTPTESKPADKPDKVNNNTAMEDNSVVNPETVKLDLTNVSDNLKDTNNTLTEQMLTHEKVKECEKYSSAGEIEDSDVAYDPEDESLFDEIQDDVFKGGSTKASDTSRTGDGFGNKATSPTSRHNRRQRSSPKRRSHRERDHRSPSRRSQRRSHSHSRRHGDKDRHRRSERDRSRHRTRDPTEYSGHHRKDHTTSRHSHRRRRSSSSPRKKHSGSLSPKRHRGPPSQVIDKTKHGSTSNPPETVKTSKASSSPSAIGIKSEPDEDKLGCDLVENPVKHSLELIQNVKTEISEPPVSQVDNQISSSSLENKPSLQETWSQDKLESKIPLREIDPPLRDSPESPDPEPQFSKPSSTENIDCAKTELPTVLNIQGSGPERDAVMHSILLATSVQDDGNQTKLDMKDSKHRLIHTDLNEKGTGFSGPDTKELETQHVKTDVWSPTQSIQNTPIDGQGAYMSLIKNRNTNITDSQAVSGGSEIRNQVQGTENSSLQVNQDVTRSCLDVMQNVQITSNAGMAESVAQNETPNQFIRNQFPERPLSGSRDSISTLLSHNPNISGRVDPAEQNVSYYREALPFLKTDTSRSLPKNPDSKSGILKTETSFGGAQFEGMIFHPGTLGSHGQSPSLVEFSVDQTHSKQSEERGLGRRESQPFIGESDFSGVQETKDRPDVSNPNWRSPGSFQISPNKGFGPPGSNAPPKSDCGDAQKGLNMEVTEPIRAGSFTQNDWTAYQFHKRGLNLESQDPYKIGSQNFHHGQRNKEISPNRQSFTHDVRGPRRPDFMGDKSEIRNPELQFTMNDTRQSVHSDMMEKGPEKKGPEFEVTMHDRRQPLGSDFKRHGAEWIGPKSENPVHDSTGPGGPDFMGQRLDKRNWPERRRPDLPGPGIDRRGPNTEDPVTDWRGTGGPKFRIGSEKRGLSMEGAEQHNRQSENLDFRRPGHDTGNLSMENTGSQSRDGGRPVFSGLGPEGRCSSVESPRPDGISGFSNFREQGSNNRSPMISGQNIDRRMPGGPDFSRPLNEMRGPTMDSQNSVRRGSGRPENWRSERKGTYLGGAGSVSIEQGQETILPVMEGSTPHSGQGAPQFRGNAPESTCLNLERSEHSRRGPNLQGPASNMAGSVLNRTRPGGPRIGIQDKNPEESNIRDTWREREAPNMKLANSSSPPRGSQFKCPEQGRTSAGGAQTVEMSPRVFRRPGNENRGQDYEGPVPDRQNPRGPNFREPIPVRPGPGMDRRKPDWREPSSLDCRSQGTREEAANTESLRHERQNDWLESEPVQEFPDCEVLDTDRRGRNFRPLRAMRRNIRRPGPNARGSAPSRRGGTFEGKWSDRRGPRFEELERGGSSGDIWEKCDDGSFETFQDYDEQTEGFHSHDDSSEWQDTQDRENMQFTVSGDDWDRPAWAPGPVQDSSDMDCSGANREGEEHEWIEPNSEGSEVFFRGRGGSCNRRQNWGRIRGRGRGSPMQRHTNVEEDWRQQGFRGDTRSNDGGMPRAHRGGFSSKNPHPNRRPFKRETPGGPDLRFSEPGYRNFNDEGPESDGGGLDFGESESERHTVDMDDLGTGAQEFDHGFRRVRRGPINRQPGPSNAKIRGVSPDCSDLRHGRWDANSEFSQSDRRGPDKREREERHTSREGRGPHQEGHGAREGPPAPFKRPVGPRPNREEKPFRDFDKPQNQQAMQPQRHRGALLPTPSGGPLSLPNTAMKSHDGSSTKTPQFGPPFSRNRGTGRGRAVDNRFRGHARGRGRRAPAH
uniref:TFIIS central domain-containing protein n=1 Tax=Fundulus heteroclitus TaxID=8078 RepID=A0A3Q2PR53_FUNHE